MGNLSDIGIDNIQAKENTFEVLPAGMYTAAIVASELKQTKDWTGKYLELKHQILEGEHKGRFVTARINVVNQNAKAQEIGQRQLGEIKFVLGSARDTTEWHGKIMTIKVAVRPEANGYGPSNEIKNWFRLGGDAGQPAQAPAPSGAATGAAAGAAWRTPPAQATADPSIPF